jgi:uncharacterized protein with HEPN domain
MNDEIRKWLIDILQAINHIDVHLNYQRNFTVYPVDEFVVWSVIVKNLPVLKLEIEALLGSTS